MSKNYVQDGNTVDFVATADQKSGDAISLGDLIGVCHSDVANTAKGVANTTGVWNLPKVSADDISSIGTKVYLKSDGNITTTASGNKLAGKAWSIAGTGTASVDVKINC